LTGLGGVAVLAPVLGGLTVALAGWRATLLLLAAGSGITLALVWRHYHETTPGLVREATRIAPMLRTWSVILKNPVFLRFTLLSMFTYSGVYAYLAGSPFVMVGHWGVPRPLYGAFVGVVAIAYIAGTMYCRRSVRQYGVRRTIGVGGWFSLAGGGAMGLLALAGVETPWAIVLPHCVYMFGHGLHQPCTQSGAVGPFPHAAGAASALTGFGMVLFAFPIGLLLGYALDTASYPLPATIAGCALATFVMARTVARSR
jgi:DHA1 family bicyclomycin/chloramphenicol resistance-like MFS transporter